MIPEFIEEAIRASGTVTLRHQDGNIYYLDDLVKMKVDNEWVAACTYHCVSPFGRFCRALGDFEEFTYLYNETISGPR